MSAEFKDLIGMLRLARGYLLRAREKLDAASTFSIIDIFLGGLPSLVADVFEYSAFSEAKRYVEMAVKVIEEVRQRLLTIPQLTPILNDTTLWAILDIGFDNFFIDLLRHMKIEEAKDKVDEMIREVDRLIFRLEKEASKSN